jgi:hypothetical protein
MTTRFLTLATLEAFLESCALLKNAARAVMPGVRCVHSVAGDDGDDGDGIFTPIS